MKLRPIDNFNSTDHSWKFQEKGITYFLTSPGAINEENNYRMISDSNLVEGTFRIIGGGMLLQNDEIKPYRVLQNIETQIHFIIASEDFNSVIELL